MSISQIENSVLSRWIALKFGWKFGTRDECAPQYPDGSLGECWWYEGLPYAESEIPDFVSDPAAILMLMERPNFSQVVRFDNEDPELFDGKSFYYASFCAEPHHSNGFHHVVADSKALMLGRAVAEAFALSVGWIPDSEESR